MALSECPECFGTGIYEYTNQHYDDLSETRAEPCGNCDATGFIDETYTREPFSEPLYDQEQAAMDALDEAEHGRLVRVAYEVAA